MTRWLSKTAILIGLLLIMTFIGYVAIEYKYSNEESSLSLSYYCLAFGIGGTLNKYYVDHGKYPSESFWAEAVLGTTNLNELGCGPFKDDAGFLEKGYTYKAISKDEASLHLKYFSDTSQPVFHLKFGEFNENVTTPSVP